MSDEKPKKIRRRRTTGRVGGTTQSAFATNSMTSVLNKQAEKQAEDQARKKKAEPETPDAESAGKGRGDEGE